MTTDFSKLTDTKEARRERQRRRRQQLNEAARTSGWGTWAQYETAVINGQASPEENKQMNWQKAINILRTASMGSDEHDAAAAYVVKAARLPETTEAFDWIREGDFDGSETPGSIHMEYSS